MADPYGSLGQGFSSGLANASTIASIKMKQQENAREAQQQKFDNLRKNIDINANVLKSDVPMEIRQAAGNNILNLYKTHAADLGIDPSQVPSKLEMNGDFVKEFSNQVLSMNKLYEKGIINRNDYRVGMFSLATKYKDTTGKENPAIMSMADNVADKDRKTMDAVIGDKRVKLQETEPGSGKFAVMNLGDGTEVSGPATQRVEMVKPPTETERTNIASTRADIEMYDTLKDIVTKNPHWVGFGKDSQSKIEGIMNTMPQDQQEFYSSMRLNKLKDTKFFLGTAQSKQEAQNAVAAIPDISMGSKQLLGAIEATKKNKQRMLDRTMEVLRQSGLKVPEDASPEAVLAVYNHAKAAGKIKPGTKAKGESIGSARPSLAVIFNESENGGE